MQYIYIYSEDFVLPILIYYTFVVHFWAELVGREQFDSLC